MTFLLHESGLTEVKGKVKERKDGEVRMDSDNFASYIVNSIWVNKGD